MDREVIEQKLESLRRCLRRIETKCPTDAATLAVDLDLRDNRGRTTIKSD
jgi:hypothetical protein